MNEIKQKLVVACPICGFLIRLVDFSFGMVWRDLTTRKLLIVGVIIALPTSFAFSVSQAGCVLVAYAIFIAASHNFFKSQVTSLKSANADRKSNIASVKSKNADMESRVANVKSRIADMDSDIEGAMNDIANMNLASVELILAFIGTLLWGFGPV